MADRTRTYDWEDPIAALEKGRTLSGIEYLQAMQRGELPPPPIAKTLDFTVEAVELGRVEFICTPQEWAYNPIGMVHGGLVCTLLDSALGCAGQSTLPAGVGYTSIDLNVTYLRPVLATTGLIRIIGTVIKPGRKVIATRGEVRDSQGKLLATATSSLLVLGGRSTPPQ